VLWAFGLGLLACLYRGAPKRAAWPPTGSREASSLVLSTSELIA
jgi:hypothetical protein